MEGPTCEPFELFAPVANAAFLEQGQYQALGSERQEIRLLCLLPGEADEPLHGTLLPAVTVVDVEECHPYMALSYVVGDVNETEEILVNGCSFNITTNLAIALRRVRSTSSSLRLWVDQICINQHDNIERAQQVLLMRDIFAHSGSTVVFLGDHPESDKAMEMLDRIFTGSFDQSPWDRNIGKVLPDGWCGLDEESIFRAAVLSVQLINRGNSPEFAPLLDLYASQWFSRNWAAQEFAVSKVVYFMFGSDMFPEHEFIKAMTMLAAAVIIVIHRANVLPDRDLGQVRRFNRVTAPIIRLDPLIIIRSSWVRGERSTLISLLRISRALQCSDPRDRVYSILGLAEDSLGIVPDYSADNETMKLFMGVAMRLVFAKDGLDILAEAQESRNHLDWVLPTWVPDWTTTADHILPFSNLSSLRYARKSPAGDLLPDIDFMSAYPGSWQILLRVKAYRLMTFQDDELGELPTGCGDKDVNDAVFDSSDITPTLEAWFNLAQKQRRGLGEPLSSPNWSSERLATAMCFGEELYARDSLKLTLIKAFHDRESDHDYQPGREFLTSVQTGRGSMTLPLEPNWRFFCTVDGKMGMVSTLAKAGYHVYVVPGCCAPLLMRPHGSKAGFVANRGAVYVHGYMDGKAVEDLHAGKGELEEITIY